MAQLSTGIKEQMLGTTWEPRNKHHVGEGGQGTFPLFTGFQRLFTRAAGR